VHSKSLRVLLVEDNPSEAAALRETLREASEWLDLVQVGTLRDALTAVACGGIDIALVDGSLPDGEGLNAVRILRDQAPAVPLIMLAEGEDEAQELLAIQQGAQDFLIKRNLNCHLLVRAMRYAVERHRMLEQLEQARRVEHYVATHDVLTQLPNRQLFHDRLSQALADARRNHRKLAVLFLDLDRFKPVNDTLGHAAGDRLLRAVAQRLTGCLRQSDTAARLGGDEFTIILTRVNEPDDAARVAAKILASLSEPFVLDGFELVVTASVGISVFPGDGADNDTLIKNADAAMYRAKANGKNAYQFYLPAMNDKAQERMELERSLRTALDHKQLELYYQPQIDIASGRIIGMEALARWNHPSLGLVGPERFIPLAEETGLILPLGEWVLRTACSQNRAWQDAGLQPISMAVNISARQLQQSLVPTIVRILRETRLDAEYLELELTESVVMADADVAIATLRELNRLGVLISIDDFGTGYSSLTYLKRLPLDKLKIDKHFVSTLTTDSNDRAITAAIVAMADSLQLKAIAEGVETAEQLEMLRTMHCDKMQGFLFSEPVDAAAATRLLSIQTARPVRNGGGKRPSAVTDYAVAVN